MSIHKRRTDLLEELIGQTVGLTLGNPRLDALVRTCKEQVDFHSFLDTHPNVVKAEWTQLKERVEDNAQFDKAMLLGSLSDRLLALVETLPSSQRDFPYRQLSFLLAASRNVLRTAVDPALLAPASANSGPADLGHPDDWSDEANSDDEWWANQVSYSSDSDLSQWSGEEREKDSLSSGSEGIKSATHKEKQEQDVSLSERFREVTGAHPADLPAVTVAIEPVDGLVTPHAVSRKNERGPSRHRRESPRRYRQPYGPTSLAVWLAAKGTQGQIAKELDPRKCFTDAELVGQVLNMLKGLKAPGPAFTFEPSSASYHVLRGVHTADLAPASTENLLEKFAALATQLRRVQAFSDAIIFTSAAEMETSPSGAQEIEALRALPTVAAFGAAVSQQVLSIRGQLVDFEELLANNSDHLKLLSLRLKLAVVSRQVTAVHQAVQGCRWRGDPARTAASVLDVLHNALEVQLMQSGSHGGVVAGMLGEIFAAAWEPLATAIDNWLLRGSLDSAPPEFFIFKIEESGHGVFWSDAFMLRRQDDGTVAAPALLKPIADQLLSAGLAAVGLQQQSKQQQQYGELHSNGIAMTPLPATVHDPSSFEDTSTATNEHEPESGNLYLEFCGRMKGLLLQWAPSHSTQELALNGGTALPAPPPPLVSSLAAKITAFSSSASMAQNSKIEDEGGSCIEEWAAAVARSPSTAVVPFSEDLSDLPLLPPTPLDLPAAALCPAATAFDPGNDAEGWAQHPVAHAMHQATTARAQQAAAGRAEVLTSAFTSQFNGNADNSTIPNDKDGTFQQIVQANSPPRPPSSSEEEEGTIYTSATGSPTASSPTTSSPAGVEVADFGGEREWEHMFTRVARELFNTSNPTTSKPNTATQRLDNSFSSCQSIFAPALINAAAPPSTSTSRPESASLLPTDPSVWASSLPLQVLGDRSLLQPIREKISQAGKRTCDAMLRAGLIPQLTTLRHIAAAGGPEMESFVQYLLTHISTSRGVDGLSPFELNMALANALGAGREGNEDNMATLALPAAHAVVKPSAGGKPENFSPGQLATTVASMHRVMLSIDAPFPVNLIADDSFLQLHTAVSTLSLQLQWVEQSLVRARVSAWKKGAGIGASNGSISAVSSPATRVTQQQMIHLVRAMRMHMLTALEVAGGVLESAIVGCVSLSEIVAHCKEFEGAVRVGCLLETPEHDVRAVLIEGLESSLRHCILLGHARRVEADLLGVGAMVLASDAKVRLARIKTVIQATERQFTEHRARLLTLIAAQGHSGAHSDAARGLLATLDPDGRLG